MSHFILNCINHGASTEIEKEGFKLNEEGISEWLWSKNIINKDEILMEFSDTTSWSRTGGETYGTSFFIKTVNISKQIFIKALVTTSPEKSIQDWNRRRHILEKNGIPVSNWYWFGSGIIIEDYYEKDAIGYVNFNTLVSIGFKLDQLGFKSLKFLDDIRSDLSGCPYYVDFGFDLGEPSETKKFYAKDYLIKVFNDKTEVINSFYGYN